MSRRLLLALVLVVALAGCLGGVVDDGTDEPSTETTEEPTETDDATETDTTGDSDGDTTDSGEDDTNESEGEDAEDATEESDGGEESGDDDDTDDQDAETLAPGVTTDGVDDPDALLDAHGGHLVANGFELAYSSTSVFDERDDLGLGYDLAVEPDAERALATIDGPNEGGEYVTWGNETLTASKIPTDEGAQYDVSNGSLADQDPVGLTLGAELQRLFANGEFAVESTEERDGRTYVTLVATEFDEGDGEAEIVLDDRGVVHEAAATTTDSSGETILEYEITAVGGVTVDRPAWVDDVPEDAALDVSVSFRTESGEYHTLTNRGEDAVPAGSTIEVVIDEEETATLELEEPLQSGERVFLYATDEGYVLTREGVDQADRIESDANSASITVVSDEGTVLYQISVGWGSDSATDGSDG